MTYTGLPIEDDFSDWGVDEREYQNFLNECEPRPTWGYVFKGIREGVLSRCNWCKRPRSILFVAVGDHKDCFPF